MVWISIIGLLFCVVLLSIKIDVLESRMYQIKDARVNRENQLDTSMSSAYRKLRQRVHKLERKWPDVLSAVINQRAVKNVES